MNEYIITCDEETASWIGNDVDSMRSLVRCRDCVHFEQRATNGVCNRSKFIQLYATPNGFCAWAEREAVKR